MHKKQLKRLSWFGGIAFVAAASIAGVETHTVPNQTALSPSTSVPTTISTLATSFKVSNTAQTPSLTSIRMFSKTDGWALDQNTVLKTTDGGKTWQNALPAGFSLSSAAHAEFLSPQYAWVTNSQGNQIRVLYTSNGGRTWQSSFINEPQGDVSTPDFINTQDGWLMVSPGGAGAGSEPIDLFKTTNGGRTWTQIASSQNVSSGLPNGGIKSGISFKDAMNGWITGENASNTPFVYVTHNGGKTWSNQTLQNLPDAGDPNASYQTTAPVFFGENGLMGVQVYAQSYSGFVMYVTHDGGKTWTRSTQSVAPFTTDDLYIVDRTTAYATDTNSRDLYVTHNGGQSWQIVKNDLGSVSAFSFTSDYAGYVISTNTNGATTLERTVDGGLNWSTISYRVR